MLEFGIIAAGEADSASFFGFLGVACALVFASKSGKNKRRSRSSLRDSQEWRRHFKHGSIEARTHYQINCASGYGWYSWNLWTDCGCYSLPER